MRWAIEIIDCCRTSYGVGKPWAVSDLAVSDLDVAIRIKFREEEGMTFRRGRSCDRFSEIAAN